MPSFLYDVLDKSFDALLISGGIPPIKSLLKNLCTRSTTLVAIDGGLNALHRYAIVPQHVVGDLDSASLPALNWARRHRARIHSKPSQSEPDIVKALQLCQSIKKRRVLICGTGGERSDHVLAGLQSGLLSQSHVTLLTNDVLIFPLRGRASRVWPIPLGHSVSWFGFPAAHGCTISGVRWPFRKRALRIGGFHSLSNTPADDLVHVTQESGSSLLFISLKPNSSTGSG